MRRNALLMLVVSVVMMAPALSSDCTTDNVARAIAQADEIARQDAEVLTSQPYCKMVGMAMVCIDDPVPVLIPIYAVERIKASPSIGGGER